MESRRRRAGFTMIELVAVLALAAILTATAAVSFASYRQKIALADASARVVWADQLIRDAATSTGTSATLRIDLAERRLERLTNETALTTLTDLPGGVRIERCVVAGAASGFGNVDVPFASGGRSPSYATLLVDASGRRDWIVIAGMTGQVVHVDASSIDELLASPAFRGGADAD